MKNDQSRNPFPKVKGEKAEIVSAGAVGVGFKPALRRKIVLIRIGNAAGQVSNLPYGGKLSRFVSETPLGRFQTCPYKTALR